jgi:hypothetical protein
VVDAGIGIADSTSNDIPTNDVSPVIYIGSKGVECARSRVINCGVGSTTVEEAVIAIVFVGIIPDDLSRNVYAVRDSGGAQRIVEFSVCAYVKSR